MRKVMGVSALVLVMGVAGCDELDSDLERGAAGAALGCVAGEVIFNGRCVEGAVVGGAGGVLADNL